jgi:hypothetical protein
MRASRLENSDAIRAARMRTFVADDNILSTSSLRKHAKAGTHSHSRMLFKQAAATIF